MKIFVKRTQINIIDQLKEKNILISFMHKHILGITIERTDCLSEGR
jgi:hypothetical protein